MTSEWPVEMELMPSGQVERSSTCMWLVSMFACLLIHEAGTILHCINTASSGCSKGHF